MSYFEATYYTDYFDIGAAEVAAAVVRAGGGLAPSKEEWEQYLRQWHENRRQEAAEKAALKGLRQQLREAMFPPSPKIERRVEIAKEVLKVEEKVKTFISLRKHDDTEIRLKIAELLIDLRRRTRQIKAVETKKKKRKRDEETILALLH